MDNLPIVLKKYFKLLKFPYKIEGVFKVEIELKFGIINDSPLPELMKIIDMIKKRINYRLFRNFSILNFIYIIKKFKSFRKIILLFLQHEDIGIILRIF